MRLQPENDALEPIRSTEVKVLGKVVGVSGGSRDHLRCKPSPAVVLGRPCAEHYGLPASSACSVFAG